jgi:cytochrome oxidase Cu insertion factor (SCO1/SenC/PrrC family)
MLDLRKPVVRASRPHTFLRAGAALLAILALAACGSTSAESSSAGPASTQSSTATAAVAAATAAPSPLADRPEWFALEMTDVQSGEPFTVNDFAGKVVLLEAMAVWCPTCRTQGDEVKRLHELLGDPEDLVSISLDVDMGEDAALLKNYAETLGYDWNIAVAPLLVARALGNLYSAQYLNPPVSPMLIIDRDGNVLGLPFGIVKSAESLRGVVEPLLGS